MDVMARSLRSEVAWAVFLVDAKDDSAAAFYAHFGFLPFKDQHHCLFLPRKTLQPLFERKDLS